MAAIALVLGGFTGMLTAATGLLIMDLSWGQAAMTYFTTVSLIIVACFALRFRPTNASATELQTA